MTLSPKIRGSLREREDRWCARCGLVRATNAHHRKNRSQGGQDVLSNLLLLCGSGTTGCHGYITEHPAEAYENGWSVRSHQDPADQEVLYRGTWVLLDDLGNLTDAPCRSFTASGSRCELNKGHDGKHYRAWPNQPGGFWWDDETQTAVAARYASRLDG